MRKRIQSAKMVFLLMAITLVAQSLAFGQKKDVSHIDAKAIVKKASENFCRSYAKNYLAFSETVMDVKSNGKYIQVMAQDALVAICDFKQKTSTASRFYEENSIRYFPLEQYVTDLIIPGTKQHLTNRSNYSNNTLAAIDKFYVEYSDDFDSNIIARYDALHIYSPLNPKMIGNYAYELESKRSNGYVIKFKTIKGFPKPMRIHTEGRLYIDLKMTVKAIEVNNMEDRYSSFMYNNYPQRHAMACNYTYIIEYKHLKDAIVTQRIVEEIQWIEPQDKTQDRYYCPCEQAPYKHPFKHKISTRHNILFSRHIIDLPEEIYKKLKSIQSTDAPNMDYMQTVNVEYWGKKWSQYSEMPQILKDLMATQEELDKQAVENLNKYNKYWTDLHIRNAKSVGISDDDIEKDIVFKKKWQSITQKLYKKYYGKEFYDR